MYVNSQWNNLFNQSNKWRSLQLVKIAYDNGLIDKQRDHEATRIITSEEINQYIDKVILCTDINKLIEIFHYFKEEIIDALSDCEPKTDTVFIGLDLYQKQFETDDIFLKAQNRIRGDLFLCPGGARVVGKYPEDIYGLKHDYGVSDKYIVAVETWITSHHEDNWNAHGHPLIGRIDTYIPCQLFMGKKEGDIVKFSYKKYDIKLTLKQRPYKYGDSRYDSPTPFEKIMTSNTKSLGGIYVDDFILSREEQKQMIQKIHGKYIESLKSINR